MRTTINIPGELLAKLQELTGEKSKTRAICLAIEDYIRKKKIEKLLSLQGKIQIDDVTDEIERMEIEETEEEGKRWGNS